MSIPAVVPHLRPAGSWPQFRVTIGSGLGSPSPVIGLPAVVRRAFAAAACASARVSMFCVASRTAAPRPRTDNWTRDSAMAGSFVGTDSRAESFGPLQGCRSMALQEHRRPSPGRRSLFNLDVFPQVVQADVRDIDVA